MLYQDEMAHSRVFNAESLNARRKSRKKEKKANLSEENVFEVGGKF